MKKLILAAILSFALVAYASEKGSCIIPVNTSNATSTGICDIDAGATGMVAMWVAGANVWLQCPGISVYIEPRGGKFIYSVPVDGGPIFADAGGPFAGPSRGNIVADFTNPDPFVVELTPNERNISLMGASDSGTCTLGPTPRAKH